MPADGGASDPARYHTPSVGGYRRNASERVASQRVAFVLYDSNLTLAWDRLRPDADYVLRLLFHDPFHPAADRAPITIVAGGGTVLLPPYSPTPTEVVGFSLPRSETATGSLRVTCAQKPGGGGSGRGCGIAEVWLAVKSLF